MKTPVSESRVAPASVLRTSADILLRVTVFAAVVACTYFALVHGFAWVVAVLFAGGLGYAGVLFRSLKAASDFPETQVAVTTEPVAAEEAPRKERPVNPELRARVLDELILGKTDPEVMARAEKIAGVDGQVAACYVDLRVALLAGEGERQAG